MNSSLVSHNGDVLKIYPEEKKHINSVFPDSMDRGQVVSCLLDFHESEHRL